DIKWENTSNRAEFRWHGDFSLRDLDGSLTDGLPDVPKLPGSLIIGKANHLPADKCGPSAPGAGDLGTAFGQGVIPGVRCLPDVTALRFAVDQVIPARVMGNNMTVTLLNGGTEQVPFKTEALTDKQGWMTTLVNNRTYVVNWNAVSTFSNLSYIGYLENFRVNLNIYCLHIIHSFVKCYNDFQIKFKIQSLINSTKIITVNIQVLVCRDLIGYSYLLF
ncbi:unnamed protein product, partial [Trichobilharzia regenti]